MRTSRYVDADQPQNGNPEINKFLNYDLVSLTDSLRPVSKDMGNLSDAIRIAKKLSKKNGGLHEDQAAAIYLYTMELSPKSVYSTMNCHLRTNDLTTAKVWFPYMKLLYTAVSKLPSFSGSVWRGVRRDLAKHYRKNAIIHWSWFTSSTKSITATKNFISENCQGTIFMIECTNGKELKEYSEHPGEDEVLLLPGITLVVVDDALNLNGMNVIHLKQTEKDYGTDKLHSATGSTSLPLPSVEKKASSDQKITDTTDSGPAITISCPHCSAKCNLTPNFKIGLKLECYSCHKYFREGSCPHCKKRTINACVDEGEGHATICQYCNKQFQMVSCPNCQEVNIWKNPNYIPGLKIDCHKCKRKFQHINCPHCSTANLWKDADRKDGAKTACYKCGKHYQYINCPSCSQANVWKNADRSEGSRTSCCHCKKPFQHVNCPNCSEANVWKNLDYCEGSAVPCWSCKKKFQQINCPHCKATNFWKNADRHQGTRTPCYSCKKEFQALNCPHCSQVCIWKNLDYQEGGVVSCWSCKKSFQHINCKHCKQANYWKEANRRVGTEVECYYCKKKT